MRTIEVSLWRTLLVITLLVSCCIADSLPPLQEGKIPVTWDQLWSGYDPAKDPLETLIVREWKEGDITFRYIIFTIGTFKGQKSRLAAYYAFPSSDHKLPAVLHLHGGGQRAFLHEIREAAEYGFVGLSINHGGQPMEDQKEGEPNTEWGNMGKDYDPIENSPRNDFWFHRQLAARRGITFLEQQPEVDSGRIGVYGHSVGGRMTTEAAVDRRLRAAVPSCGGSGVANGPIGLMAGSNQRPADLLVLNTVDTNAYLPHIRCPILFLNPMNEWNSPTDVTFENWKKIGSQEVRFSCTPHIYHRHLPEYKVCQWLWFEQHLNHIFTMPQSPRCSLQLDTLDRIPRVNAAVDSSLPVKKVDIYYSSDPHCVTRFWRDAKAEKKENHWTALCPIGSADEPLYVMANVTYRLPKILQSKYKIDCFVISSWEEVAFPEDIKKAQVETTDEPSLLIDDFSRGWHDWYPFIECKPGQLNVMTRKLKDTKWQGPKEAVLKLDILIPQDNELVFAFLLNAWKAAPKHPGGGYGTAKKLKGSPQWQTVTVTMSELLPTPDKLGAEYQVVTEPMKDWTSITDFILCTSFNVLKDGQKVRLGTGRWNGNYQFRNLRWEIPE